MKMNNKEKAKEGGPRIAVVGSGYWGKNHVRNFYQLGALKAVCDKEAHALAAVQDQYPEVMCTDSYETILSNGNIDGVVLATPAVTHYDLALKALKAGKDVFVEKPLALEIHQGERLVAEAAKMGAVLMVGHILLYHPAVIKLKEMVDQGELGKIQYVQSTRLAMGIVRTEENILWSFAPHDISVILYLLNEFPTKVNATGYCHLQENVEDVTINIMEFASGVGAHIYVSWMNPFKEQRLVVIGDKRMAVFEDTKPDKKLLIYNSNFQWVQRRPVPNKGPQQEIPFDYDEPLRQECKHFIECIETRSKPRSDGEEGLRTLRVIQKCYESMRNRHVGTKVIPLPEKSQERNFFAHETAVLDEGSVVGDGTKIWHFSHVMAGAHIGKNCNIGQNVVVGKDVKIGDQCKIQNNVSVYEGVTLEDQVFCGPSMVFTNVHNPRCAIPRMHEIRPTLVKRGTTIGANATIVCGNVIGEHAFIGAGAVVVDDVENHALMVGNPARRTGWMCRCGIRLSDLLECPACGDRYREEGNNGLVSLASETSRQRVPFLDLKAHHQPLEAEIEKALKRVLSSQRFILGPEVQALEEEIAEYCKCKYAVGVSSGTDALLVSLMALEIKPGDEVITTPFTFFATMGSILRLGAKPVFADIDEHTFNLDPKEVAKVIGPKTKAIIPVHLFGQACNMDPILKIATESNIPVIEDAAQALGTEYKGRRAGSMGTVGCFSFFPSKNLGCLGDGGMVTTQDQDLADRIKMLRGHGSKPKYYHKLVGGNFRLDEIQAAVLRVKLRMLDTWTEKRRRNAEYYTRRFIELGLTREMLVPPVLMSNRHIFNQYVIRAVERDNLQGFLKEQGVVTEIYYPLAMHLQECLNLIGYKKGDFPVSESATSQVLALPIFPELSDDQKERVVSKIHKFYFEQRTDFVGPRETLSKVATGGTISV
jgi:UDP-2-acetamido-3-amino-2,3-dideoxy-glucuronate N-acetyltransferase